MLFYISIKTYNIECFVYISAAHFNVQLPVLTLIQAIFWEANTCANRQG